MKSSPFRSNKVVFLLVHPDDLISQWGSPHGYWNRIHWIWIPDPDSKWCCVSSTRHADNAHCTAGLEHTHSVTRTVTQHSRQLESGSSPCGSKVLFESRSPIRIGFGSKVSCGESRWTCSCWCFPLSAEVNLNGLFFCNKIQNFEPKEFC